MSRRYKRVPNWPEAQREYKRSGDIHRANNELSARTPMVRSSYYFPSTGVYVRHAGYDKFHIEITHACFVIVDGDRKLIFNVNDDDTYPARNWTDGWTDDKLRYEFERPLMSRRIALHSTSHGGACSLLSEAMYLLFIKLGRDLTRFITILLEPSYSDFKLVADTINE